MKFKYEGYDRTARRTTGTLEADNQTQAVEQLREMHVRPTKLHVIEGGRSSSAQNTSTTTVQPKKTFELEELFSNPKPDVNQFAVFMRQLATMQGAGIPLVQSLNILSEQSENKAFGRVLASTQKSIEEGRGFAESLRRYSHVFDDIFINLVAAGEVSGALEPILLRLSVYYEKSSALRRKIKSAMAYPIITMIAVVGVVMVMLIKVVPEFEKMFANSKEGLPASTQLIIDMSHMIQENIVFFGAAGIASLMALVQAFRAKEFRRMFDPILLKTPVFGPILLKAGVARFARTLATMIQSGVPFLDALEITAKVSGNVVIEEAVLKTKESVKEGNTIAKPLQKSGIFPKMVVGMVAVGEQTGALEKMLVKVAEFYEDEVDATVTSLTSILEPLMIIIVGLVVAGILIPLYLPVFKMGDVVGG